MQTPFFFLNHDSRLIETLRHGNEEALVELFHQNRRPVTSLVVRNQGTEDDAEDVLQETLIILWERIHRGTFEYRAKLSTFIYATAKRIWLRRLAQQRREIRTADGATDMAAEDPTPLEEMEENERILAIQKAMEQIGNPCRELLLLYYWEEQSMEEIAVKLGFANADTVKSKKYQCKKSLGYIVKNLLGGLE